jgi:hypothetical protein
MTVLGCLILLTGCFPTTDDAVGLRALEPSIRDLGVEVIRVDDGKLTSAYRNLAATWKAAVND